MPRIQAEPTPEPTSEPQPKPAQEPVPESTPPQQGNKGGGHVSYTTRSVPRKRGLLDRLEEWLTRD